MFTPKRNERLDNVIEKLKDHIGFVRNPDEDDMDKIKNLKALNTEQTAVTTNASSNIPSEGLVHNSGEDMDQIKNLKTLNTEQTDAITNASSNIPSGDSSLTYGYLMWENNANVCWLDASMALLAHNQTLKQSVNEISVTQIANIIHHYYKAVLLLNDVSGSKHLDERLRGGKDTLKTVQESALKYLQPILKYKEGEPDSAFCCLLNFIVEDKSVKDFFDLEYTWVQACEKCNTRRVKTHRKPIVTLPRVECFQPSSPISLYQCLVCKTPDQRMTLNFKTLPRCLLFHFESGAGKGELECSSFKVADRTYKMTGVMTLEKGKESNSNHFVTFIRDPSSDMWLECNDLCEDVKCFLVHPPYINLKDVYILMFEAMDGNGTIPNCSLATDNYELGEELSNESDIPVIDLEEEDEEKAKESEEKDSMSRKAELSGKDREEGSYKDVNENACLMENDRSDGSCENVISLVKDPVHVSSSNFKDVSLYGTDCGDDSTKDQGENLKLLKPVYRDELDLDKYKPVGLFGQFHLACNDESSQDFFEVHHGVSMGDATLSGCAGTTPSESGDALLDEVTSVNAIVNNPIPSPLSQLHINNMGNSSLQSESSSVAYVSSEKDISSSKNMESTGEGTHSPNTIQPDADSKSSKGVKKKMVEKDKLSSLQKILLPESIKIAEGTSTNSLVPEISESDTSGIQLGRTNNTSLKVASSYASQTLTESKTSVVSQSKEKTLLKNTKQQLQNISTVKNKFSETHNTLQDSSETSCIAPETKNESSLQDLDVIKKINKQPRNKALEISSNQPRKQLIAKKKKSKTLLKNVKQKSVDSSIVKDISTKYDNVLENQSIAISNVEAIIESVSKIENIDVTKEELKIQSDHSSNNFNKPIQLGNINRNLSQKFSRKENFENNLDDQPQEKEWIYPNDPCYLPVIAGKNNAKSLLQNRNRKNLNLLKGEQICTEKNIALQEKAIDNTSSETVYKCKNSLQTQDKIGKKKLRKISDSKMNYPSSDLNLSNDTPNVPLITKQSKAITKNKKRKCMDNLMREISSEMADVIQENVSSRLHLNGSSDDAPKKSRRQLRNLKPAVQQQNGPDLEMSMNETSNINDQNFSSNSTNSKVNKLLSQLNLSNKTSDVPLITKQSSAFMKNRKHKYMDNLTRETSSEEADVVQENLPSHFHLNESSDDVPPKKTRRQLKNFKPAVQQQNVPSRFHLNESSDDVPPKKTRRQLKNFKPAVQQQNVPSHFHLNESSDDVPPKKTRRQLKNFKPAVQLQNGPDIGKAMNKTSANVNNQNYNYFSSNSTNSKGNEPLSNLNLPSKTPDVPLITKQSKAKPFLKNRKRNCMDNLTRETSSEESVVMQENVSSSIHLNGSSNQVPPKKTKHQLKNLKPAVQQQNRHNLEMAMNETSANNVNDQNDKNFSSNSTNSNGLSSHLNLSNKSPDVPLITKQSRARLLTQNRRRKCMDNLTRETSSGMALQENVPSHLHLNGSSDDIPPKKTRHQLKNLKPAVQQQNGPNLEMAMNETSANNVNDKNFAIGSANSKLNKQLPSLKALHGPDCICDSAVMTDELADIVIGTVLKGVFKFIGLKEKK